MCDGETLATVCRSLDLVDKSVCVVFARDGGVAIGVRQEDVATHLEGSLRSDAGMGAECCGRAHVEPVDIAVGRAERIEDVGVSECLTLVCVREVGGVDDAWPTLGDQQAAGATDYGNASTVACGGICEGSDGVEQALAVDLASGDGNDNDVVVCVICSTIVLS